MNEVKEEAAQGERQELSNNQLLMEIAENMRVIRFCCEFFMGFFRTNISQTYHLSESLFEIRNAKFIKDGLKIPD